MRKAAIKKLEKFLTELARDDEETSAVKARAAELELTHGLTKLEAGEKALTEHFQNPLTHPRVFSAN